MKLSGEQLHQYARDIAASLEDVSNGRPFTAHLDVWKVREKVFLIVTDDDPNQQIITLKVDPHRGDALRRDVETITMGRYLNKKHWITIGPGVGITRQLIGDLVLDSYDFANDLHRKQQP